MVPIQLLSQTNTRSFQGATLFHHKNFPSLSHSSNANHMFPNPSRPNLNLNPHDRLTFQGSSRPEHYFDINTIRSESLRQQAARKWALALRALDPIFPLQQTPPSENFQNLLGYSHSATSGYLDSIAGRPLRYPDVQEFNKRTNALVSFFLDRIVNAQHFDFITQPGGGGLLPQVPQNIPIRLEIPFEFFKGKNLTGINFQRLWLEEHQTPNSNTVGPLNLQGTVLNGANLKGAWILNPKTDPSTRLQEIQTDPWTQSTLGNT